jgi:type VI secretion system protein VasD
MRLAGPQRSSARPGLSGFFDTGLLGTCRLSAAGLAFAVAACGGPPPPPPPPAPTIAQLKLSVSADVNPTQSGEPAPVVVRVYQLTSSTTFDQAEFFRLLNTDAATLGPDLVKKEEYLLPPNGKKEETLTIPDRVEAIGVFAAYREFQTRSWRVTVPVPPHKTTPVSVSVSAAGLSVVKAP